MVGSSAWPVDSPVEYLKETPVAAGGERQS